MLVLVALAAVGQAAAGRYTVREGDTLSAISRRFGVSVADLVAANHLADPNHIRYGATLTIPDAAGAAVPPTVHVVQPGEHLDAIARQYGTTAGAIAVTNRLRDPNLVIAGARLVVPRGPAAAQGPPELRARADRLQLAPRFDHWAAAYGVPADLMKAMTWYESGWQNQVVSSTGARGIGQLMPATVQFINTQLLHGRYDAARSDDNIRMSTRFMRFLLDSTHGRADLALAAYYQGLTSTLQGRILAETRQYVAGVLAFRAHF
jgi:LysM repeat protein